MMINKIKAWFSELGLPKEAKCTKEFGTYCWLSKSDHICSGCTIHQFDGKYAK